MYHFFRILCLVALCGYAQAQPASLKFSKNGTFKIAQFTDMHLDPQAKGHPTQLLKTLSRLSRVLDAEHPDLVIFTGDIVTGRPAAATWQRVLDSVAVRKIPFCVVLGNHDAEQDIARTKIAQIVTKNKYSLNTLNASGELADRQLIIGTESHPDAVLYCMDSHDYSTLKSVEGYGWFLPEQIDWYSACSRLTTAANKGVPPTALAFFHIVLRESVAAWRNPENSHIGRAAEDECPGALNTGMFAAMAQQGDVVGMFVGHDHDNDYLVAENGIAMGYGRFSGDDTTYNNLRPGARLIVLHKGTRGFETWIREDDGRIVDHARMEHGKISSIK